ncbi:MAG: NADH-quinone oxidoreductase subunit NuoE [Anaerolineales bacterium]|nr:MAG: NADH-quinone oxidoreductase subunit NuoE [Anaerolineales bacterium]
MLTSIQSEQDVISIVESAVTRHGAKSESLVPILSEINQEFGYLPGEVLSEVSRVLNMPRSHLISVASFYHMLSTKPRGRHLIQFCESAPCHVMHGRQVWQILQDELGLEPGQTSADGKWTLVTSSCLGICGVGPVIIIDDDTYGNVTPERVPDILARYV